MTLSSTSRQHRKSMLPTPRLSSRLSSRRTTSGETSSRIARRAPSPMFAAPTSLINTSSASAIHSRVPHPPASRSLPPPEFGTRRACSPSRIPSPSVQPSFLTPDQSETSFPTSTTPRAEGGSVETPYPTPPASVETKHERFVGQEGRAKIDSFSQPQRTISSRGPPPPARHPSRRRESSALNSFSRTENSTSGDVTSSISHHPVVPKKLAMTTTTSSSVTGKENRRPPARTRVLVPVAPAVVVPPRPIQQTTVTDITSSEVSPRPLVIKKKKTPQTLMTNQVGQNSQAKSADEPCVAPLGIKALIGDLDRFAKEWTGIFDDLYGSAGRHGDVVSDGSTRIHPIVESENPETSQADDLGERSGLAGGTNPSPDSRLIGEITAVSRLAPSASASSIDTIQASSTDGDFDVSAASLVRWQHRDNTMLKNAPTVIETMPELRTIVSPTDTHHSQKVVRRSAPQPITPRVPRLIPPLPEINQSPIISGPHLVEMTSSMLSNRKDGITKYLESPPLTPTETTRRNASSRPSPLSSSSPSPIAMSLVSVSIPHTSSPLSHQRLAHDHSPPQRAATYALGDAAAPTRSTSLRGLRAIFKRTSAGLTNGHRQRAESLKELIGEPRVLSLGSISISNLRDAGIPSGGVVPVGLMDDVENSAEVVLKTAVRR